MPSEKWNETSTLARENLYNSIPPEWRIPAEKLPPPSQLNVVDFPAKCGILTDFEVDITESAATEIVKKIAVGEWKAEDVARAFCKRAAVGHQVTNCLTVLMYPEAISRAKELDAHLARTGTVVGPLHGLPISLKDNFNIPGKPSSLGFCSFALEPMEEESTIVGILRDLGAVAYVKTNVPTAMMIPETVNNCFGRTVNPLNRNLTPGGSSGGESALLTLYGSPLGVGTDIGGSLRIPAACTGLYTLRPSFGRFPNFDARSGLSGQEAVGSVHGPMARSLPDLRLFAENVANAEPWLRDPKCLPLRWRKVEVGERKVKIAVVWGNGLVTPTPPVQRALKTTVEKLKRKGYEIIDWDPEGYAEAKDLIMRFFTADGGKSIEKILEPVDEPFRPEMKNYEAARDLGVYDLWQLHKQRTALQKRWLDRWAACEGLDAILSPTTPYAAPRNGQFRVVSYTGIFNLLDYSSVSFPSGIYADESVDVYPSDFRALGADDKVTKAEYDSSDVHGMPVSLQLTCRRLEEEKVVALTERIARDIA